MRKLLPVVLLLLVATTSGGGAPQRSLVAINDPLPDAAAALLDSGIQVVRDMDRYLLAVVDPADIASRRDAGGTWRILDESMEGKAYYTVTLHGDGDVERLTAAARVLRADRYDAVVEIAESQVESLLAEGFEVARVFVRPIRPARSAAAETAQPKSMVADPFIQDMVDGVVSANVDANVLRLQNFVTRYCTTDSAQAAANWIRSKFQSYGIENVVFQTIPGGYKPNVVATFPGVGDPSRVVVIGAHYDSYAQTNNAPGADDNASGTAGVIETARVLSQHTFNYTIKFVAFGAEELGLYGSEEFAAQAAASGMDIIGAVCIDMIGYLASGDAVDLDIIDNTASLWLRNLAFQVRADYVPGFATVDGTLPGGASSDHASFWAHGYNAILFFEDSGSYSPYIHTTSDRIPQSYNSPVLAFNSVKTAVALVATMAEPFRVSIGHAPLGDTDDVANPYPVLATITAAETLNPDSILVVYDAGDGPQRVLMTPTGDPDEYGAEIPAQPAGTFVDYYIVAEDMTGYRRTDPAGAPASVYSFFVGTIESVFFDDVETANGWALVAAGDNATTGRWERGDPQGTTNAGNQVQAEDDHTAAPGVMCFATGLSAGASAGSFDVDGGKTTLLSPVFDLSGHAYAFVSYWRWFTNNLGAFPDEDYWQVQVTSNGTTWVNLEYTLESRNAWTKMSFPVHEYVPLTANVRFRFIATDTSNNSLVEAAVDDFEVSGWQPPEVGVEGVVPARVVLVQNAPNPFNPATLIRFSVPAPGEKVTLRVFDAAGRRVRTLLGGEKVSGWRTAEWNGTDDSGRPVASGIYLYRLDAGARTITRKMTLVK